MYRATRWHAQLSTELGSCLRTFVAAEQSVSMMQLEVWSRVLGLSVSTNRRSAATAAAAAAAAAATPATA